MYRNYDGNKSTFGDTSVAATVPNPDNVSAFAAERSADGGLTVMVISKYLSGNTPASFNIANFPHNGVAQVWQLTGANAISRLTDVSFSGNTFGATRQPKASRFLCSPWRAAISRPLLLWQLRQLLVSRP